MHVDRLNILYAALNSKALCPAATHVVLQRHSCGFEEQPVAHSRHCGGAREDEEEGGNVPRRVIRSNSPTQLTDHKDKSTSQTQQLAVPSSWRHRRRSWRLHRRWLRDIIWCGGGWRQRWRHWRLRQWRQLCGILWRGAGSTVRYCLPPGGCWSSGRRSRQAPLLCMPLVRYISSPRVQLSGPGMAEQWLADLLVGYGESCLACSANTPQVVVLNNTSGFGEGGGGCGANSCGREVVAGQAEREGCTPCWGQTMLLITMQNPEQTADCMLTCMEDVLLTRIGGGGRRRRWRHGCRGCLPAVARCLRDPVRGAERVEARKGKDH